MRARCATIVVALLAVISGAAAAANDPRTVARAAMQAASQPKSWLGVWLGDSVDGGVEVVALVPGGPCQQAGVQIGDIFVQANDVELTGQGQLRAVLSRLGPGEPLQLVVLRGGQPVETLVQTAHRPLPPAPIVAAPIGGSGAGQSPRAPGSAYRVEFSLPSGLLGLRVTSVTPALRQHYGAPSDAGVLVTGVDAGKLAALAGVEVGDVLVQLDERRIVQPQQLESALLTWNRNRPLRASLVRARRPREVMLVAGVRPAASPASDSVHADVDAARLAWQRSQEQLEARKLQLQIEQLERRIERLKRRLEQLQREP